MKKKKMLSFAMAIAMVFGSAAALPDDLFTNSTSVTASAVSTETLGKCGENLTWSLENGVLNITGTGEMYNYKMLDNNGTIDSPFVDRTDINSIIIGSGVTSIGDRAFARCTSLKNVTISETVKSIGFGAFSGSGISSIVIPDTVTELEASLFHSCPNLSSVTLPSNIKQITDSMFFNCRSLSSFTIPDTVESIGSSAFSRCRMSSIIFPESVKSIGDYAFGDTDLVSVAIPKTIKKIGMYAFANCSNLSEISFPEGEIVSGPNAFENTKWITEQRKNNTLVIVNDTLIDCSKCSGEVVIPNGIKKIGEGAFCYNTNIKGIVIPNSVEIIGDYAFSGCLNLWLYGELNIPESVKKIGDQAFFGIEGLKNLCIPSNVTEIGELAFGFYNDYQIKDPNQRLSMIKDFTLYCKKGSAAETYAKENSLNYKYAADSYRLAGSGRFATAAEISKAGFPDGAQTVVLAYGLNYADALAGVSLAAELNAPILLTAQKSLPNETLNEIKRLGATDVIILGGTGAIGSEVEGTLKKENINTERIAGTSRFETATKIAQKMQELNNQAPEDIFFVYYNGFADALSVSTVAAVKGSPVIYLKTNGELDDATAAYLTSVKGKIKNAYVIGGTGVISDDMMKKTGKALGVTPTRVFGTDRFATCVAVNDTFKDVLNGDSICVATGMDFPDALAGGVFAALNKAPLFLINGKTETLLLSQTQKALLKDKLPEKVYAFGGLGVVPASHLIDIAKASV